MAPWISAILHVFPWFNKYIKYWPSHLATLVFVFTILWRKRQFWESKYDIRKWKRFRTHIINDKKPAYDAYVSNMLKYSRTHTNVWVSLCASISICSAKPSLATKQQIFRHYTSEICLKTNIWENISIKRLISMPDGITKCFVGWKTT